MKKRCCLILAVMFCVVSVVVFVYLTQSTYTVQAPLFASSIEECTDPGKVYVLPDGYLYAYCKRFYLPQITIEEKADGYWRTDGKWISGEGMNAKRTNVIPVTPGDQLSYTGFARYEVHSVVWLDESQTEIGREQHESLESSVRVIAPPKAKYAVFYSFSYGRNVELAVEWLSCADMQEYSWRNTGYAFVPADYEDRILAPESTSFLPLHGKKIVYDGDSIAESRANNGGGYAQIIANLTGGTFVNHAQGGGRLASQRERHSVVDNLPNLPLDGDLYCFEGGINDFWGNTPIGEITPGYRDELDPATICGAMETIFRYTLNNLPGRPVCFVIVHKIQKTAFHQNAAGNTFKDYRDAMVQVCEKYSIPYYDAFSQSGLNGWNQVQSDAYLTANGEGKGDGIHPNEEGYKRYYVPQLMALFQQIMPVE